MLQTEITGLENQIRSNIKNNIAAENVKTANERIRKAQAGFDQAQKNYIALGSPNYKGSIPIGERRMLQAMEIRSMLQHAQIQYDVVVANRAHYQTLGVNTEPIIKELTS